MTQNNFLFFETRPDKLYVAHGALETVHSISAGYYDVQQLFKVEHPNAKMTTISECKEGHIAFGALEAFHSIDTSFEDAERRFKTEHPDAKLIEVLIYSLDRCG